MGGLLRLASPFRTDRKCGVGTQNPGGLLHVCSGTSGDCHLILQSDTDNNNELDNPKIVFRQDGAINTAEIGIENSGNKLAIRGTSGIAFYDGGISSTDIDNIENTSTELMRINADGNVGINDSTPSYKLDVNGDSESSANSSSKQPQFSKRRSLYRHGRRYSYYGYQNGDPGIKFTQRPFLPAKIANTRYPPPARRRHATSERRPFGKFVELLATDLYPGNLPQ